MSYTDCFNANYFKQPSSVEPYPIGSVLSIPVIAPNNDPAGITNATPASVIGAGYTLPDGVWEIDCHVITDIVGASSSTSFAVDCIAYIQYKGTKVAQSDSGWQIGGLVGATADTEHGVFVAGAVVSDGTASGLIVGVQVNAGNGANWTLFPNPPTALNVGNSNYVRAVRVA